MKKIMYLMLLVAVGISAVSCCSACRARKPMQVSGTKWGLIEMNGAVVDRQNGMSPDRLTLTLGEDGRVAGMGDCNRYFGPYTLNNGKIDISSIGSTRMMCPNQQLETEFFRMLENAASCKIDGDFLILSDGENRIIGSFKKL